MMQQVLRRLVPLAFFLASTPCSADVLTADWYDFKASIEGKFDIVAKDAAILVTHQKFPKYLVTWTCERKQSRTAPEERELCSEMRLQAEDIEAKLVGCLLRRDPSNRFVKAIVLMKVKST